MRLFTRIIPFLFLGTIISSCSTKPYALTNRAYKKQAKEYAKVFRATPPALPGGETLMPGDQWVGTTNFSIRKPNFVIIHHTAQNSTDQTLRTFTLPRTQVSSHYVIGRDGKVYHMLNDYFRAHHAGMSKWGNNLDLNSSSIGIELDNNGYEPFAEAQMTSLLQVLSLLKKNHGIPAANFIGHSDIAPSRKVDPNPTFPWKRLAENGFGLWPDSTAVDSLPANFNPQEALRIIGYDVKNLDAAIKSFKLHFIQTDLTPVLTEEDKKVLYNLYRKYY
ncbi:MAG TPA: N-acetylmuramoyl-L-alanine amidase [Sphingobacteriaceae bacterium]